MRAATMTPYYQDDAVTIYHADCRDVVRVVGGPFDLLLTDPPYGINFDAGARRDHPSSVCGRKWGKITGDTETFDPSPLRGRATYEIWWGAHHYASRLPDSHGWLVWDKRRMGTTNKGYIASDVDLAWTSWLGHCKVFAYLWDGRLQDGEKNQRRHHPTQKPLDLFRWCIQLPSNPIASVFDPFMGSGTTLRAAKDLGRKAVGIEIEEKYCEIAARRMEQGVLAL